MKKSSSLFTIAALVLAGCLIAEPASAAVSVSRAEVSGSNLRIEGTALASRSITVDGVVMGSSDSGGRFRIERSSYSPPADCTVDVNDGSSTPRVVTLSGCTATNTPPPPGDTTAPSVPTNLTATLAGTTANLSWNASSDGVGVSGYRITRNGTLLPGTVTGTTFSDPGLASGSYTYTVAARDAAGNVSGPSNTASVTVPSAEQPPPDTSAPTVPGNFTAVLRGRDNVDLTWTASADDRGVTGYRVTRNGVYRGTVLNTFYNDTFLPVGSYTYSVAATDAAGNISGSTESITLTVQPVPETDTTAPTAPGPVTTTVIGSNINVGWGLSYDDTAVAGYTVTRNGTFRITVNNSDHFDDLNLAPGTYTYSVVAFDAAGNTSGPSASTTATVSAPEGLAFLTPPRLPDAVVGEPYLAYIVSTDPPGPSTFRFRLVSGSVPNGTQFLRNTLENRPEARVSGTPTRAGTYSFTVEVRDNTGATARRTFTVTVLSASSS